MAEHARIRIDQIFTGDRLRPVVDEEAQALAASMAERGLICPITVRRTPAKGKGATPYTLVAGGHRIRAAQLLGWVEIDVMIVEADGIEAQLIEISENIYGNELSALDRAIFVMKYREIWEEQHGEIRRGRRSGEKGNDCPFIFAPGRELSKEVQERLGFGDRTYKYVTAVARNLHPALRQAVRGTKAERDQSKLLKLAKMEPETQVRLAAALVHDRDIGRVMKLAAPPKPAGPSQNAIFAKLSAAWKVADDDTRRSFLESLNVDALPFREAAE